MYNMVPFGRINHLNQFFDEVERSFFPSEHPQGVGFRTDITDGGDRYLLEAELPGFQKENIDLELKEGVLTISARREDTAEDSKEDGKYICRERQVGEFRRSFRLSGIQEDAISAAYEAGVLKLTLPKVVELQPQSRKIAIS